MFRICVPQQFKTLTGDFFIPIIFPTFTHVRSAYQFKTLPRFLPFPFSTELICRGIGEGIFK